MEAPAEGFFWNLPEIDSSIRFYDLFGSETCPIKAHFQSMEQP
jgi:hypothetical protein